MKPIDFIPNVIIEDVWYITIEQTVDISYHGEYQKEKDPKWKLFCKEHNLGNKEKHSQKWFNLFLKLCALDIL